MKTVSRAVLLSGAALVNSLVSYAPASVKHPDVDRHASGPPTAHTGGFGEPTCQECHMGGELNSPGGILGIVGMPSRYTPRTRYEIGVVLQSEDMTLAGFQGAVRFADGETRGTQAGNIEPLDARVAVVIDQLTRIQYVQHAAAEDRIDPGGVVTWTFIWMAPDARDAVMLHVAANSANGDDSPLLDRVYTAEAFSAAR
ncbi:MAG: hypothetical protein O7I93_05950 [Gemmatimonadetes bacterium]|nr:hypothetical protein [Gemmatimonadota bacterium]